MDRKLITTIAALLLVGAGATGCTGSGDEAEGAPPAETATTAAPSPPITLRVGTPDIEGRPGALQLAEFASQVEEVSGGRIKVDLVYDAAGIWERNWDQATAQLVVDGDLDLALVPTRAFPDLGATSLQALSAPFLIPDQATLDEVLTGDLAEPLMAGLTDAGLVGLTLTPEGLRHPFAFRTALLGPEDYAGKGIRAPASGLTTALFEALGATAEDLNGPEFNVAVADGTVVGADSGFALAAGLPRASVGTGNVTLYPKVNALVMGAAAYDELDDQQQEWLREAATATRDQTISDQVDEETAARDFCAAGGTVVVASEAQIEALRAAAEPVYDALAADAAALVEEIQPLAEGAEPGAAIICSPATSGAKPAKGVGPEPVLADGRYQYELPLDYLRTAGMNEETARANAGVFEVTMEEGTYTERWSNDVVGDKTATGEYVVVGDRMWMVWTPGRGSVGAWSATATVEGDTVTWSGMQAIPPDEPEFTADWEIFLSVPWTRRG